MVEPAGQFWVKHASSQPAAMAVHPQARWQGYHAWTRTLLQRWTLDRMRMTGRYQRGIDLGCGYGDWTAQFATLCDEMHGCEVAPTFVEETRRRVPLASIECSDIRDYALPRRADFVYAGAVLMYLSDPDVLDVLRRIRDATRPGALVMWRDYCTYNFGRRSVQHVNGFSVHRSARDMCKLAELAGLRVDDVRSSPSIYAEVMGGRVGRAPLHGLWKLATLGWTRASFTVVLTRE
jgi:trans-aconitate methyltransferase